MSTLTPTQYAAKRSRPRVSFFSTARSNLCHLILLLLDEGKSVVVTITDRCTGCALLDLDFSPAAYNLLALPALGRISGMLWSWV